MEADDWKVIQEHPIVIVSKTVFCTVLELKCGANPGMHLEENQQED